MVLCIVFVFFGIIYFVFVWNNFNFGWVIDVELSGNVLFIIMKCVGVYFICDFICVFNDLIKYM